MDQKKIGAFIAQCRKEKSLTQIQLAELLDITNQAVSKWENGKFDEDEGSPRTLSYNQEITLQEKDNRESKPSSNNILELEIRKERFDKLAHLVNRCIYLHRKLTLTEDIYMDIPVKEECEILRSIKRNA